MQLTIEEWEDAPPPFSDGYEDEAKCVLYLRGRLSVIDTGRSDSAVGSLRLAGGVGDYGVHVYTRNRAEAVRRYAALFEMDADPLGDEFQQAEEAARGPGAVPAPALARVVSARPVPAAPRQGRAAAGVRSFRCVGCTGWCDAVARGGRLGPLCGAVERPVTLARNGVSA